MKIDGRNGVQDSRLTGSAPAEARGTSVDGGAGGGADDQVKFSDMSRALARLFGLAKTSPSEGPTHAARLAALQQQVESGSYHPDTHATARKLILDER